MYSRRPDGRVDENMEEQSNLQPSASILFSQSNHTTVQNHWFEPAQDSFEISFFFLNDIIFLQGL